MSKYTTEVRFICEQAAGLDDSVGYNDIDEVLSEETVAKVMPEYPIFDETYRYNLNKKILEHYYTREIGFETVGLWKQKMRARMREIMPYYNQLYLSEQIKFEPLKNIELVTNKAGNKTNELTGNYDSKRSLDESNAKVNGEEFNEKNTQSGTVTNEQENAKNYIESLNEKIHGEGNNEKENIESGSILNESNENKNTNKNIEKDGVSNKLTSEVGDSKKDGTNENNSTTSTATTGVKGTEQKYSDTPQGTVENLKSGTYLTNATLDSADDLSGTVADSDGTGSFTENNKVNTNTGESQTNNDSEQENETSKNDIKDNNFSNKTSNENENLIQDETKNGIKNNTEIENYESNKKENIDGVKTGASQKYENNTNTIDENVNDEKNESAVSTDQYIENILGKTGGMTYSKMLLEYRETFLNIDKKIIDSLNDLFFGLWE